MTGKNFIGYSLSAEGKEIFHSTNPATGRILPTEFYSATDSEVNKAVDLASSCFENFNKISLTNRSAFLLAIADEIESCSQEIDQTFVAESGLDISRAEIERRRTVFQLRSFAEEVLAGNWLGASIDTKDNSINPPKPDLRRMMTGIGPVVVFGASNFPLAYSTAGGDTASALAAGCPVIVKSHPLHPGTGEIVAGAIIRAATKTGMPEGVFSNLNSIDFKVGQQLVLHPKVKAVGFTGSISGGRALFDLAASREEPIPVFAEMGSVNPVIIFPDAIKENTVEISSLLAGSVTNGAGQFCTKPGLIFLLSENSDHFIESLAEKFLETRSQVMLGKSIHEKFNSGRKKAVSGSYEKLFEVKRTEDLINLGQQTLLVVSDEIFSENTYLHNEVFGPFSIVVKCRDFESLKRCISILGGQLTASVFTKVNLNSELDSLLWDLSSKAGRVIMNGVPTGVTVCPSMTHGGPYPATTDSRFTAVGIDSMRRWLRPVSFQNFPKEFLPDVLKDNNALGILRRINGQWTVENLTL